MKNERIPSNMLVLALVLGLVAGCGLVEGWVAQDQVEPFWEGEPEVAEALLLMDAVDE